MQISPNIQKLIDIDTQSQKTQLDIATAVAKKQLDVEKQSGQEIVNLVTQAASPSNSNRGIDVKA